MREKKSLSTTKLLQLRSPELKNRPGDLFRQYTKMVKAVEALYTAAYWSSCDSDNPLNKEEEIRLWENLRKAAGIRKGTATKLGVGQQ